MGEGVVRMELPVLEIGDRTFVVPSMLRRFVGHVVDFGPAEAVAGFIFWLSSKAKRWLLGRSLRTWSFGIRTPASESSWRTCWRLPTMTTSGS